MQIVYLHGFASSPQSGKARFFARKFIALGAGFDAPRLDEGNFEALTITGQLAVIDRAVAKAAKSRTERSRIVLMGSSLGGYLAALYAARHPKDVGKLILLAPAFQFPSRWRERFSAKELEAWKQTGARRFFHYGTTQEEKLGYGFIEDGMRYEDEPDFKQPGLILHGVMDPVVPIQASRGFVERHANARLREFPSGHELTDVLDGLWAETRAFLQLPV